jgi:hypothetical protein
MQIYALAGIVPLPIHNMFPLPTTLQLHYTQSGLRRNVAEHCKSIVMGLNSIPIDKGKKKEEITTLLFPTL